MAKQKTIPELEAEKAENERRLSQLQHKKQQLENRITYYEKGDRRKRAHHLITRGAAIETVAPLTKVLTETEFYAFAEKALAVPEVKGLLMEAVNEHNRAEQKERSNTRWSRSSMSRSDRTSLHGRKSRKSNTNLYTFLGGTYEQEETI